MLFNRDDLPSPMEGGTLCDFPLAQLSGFPDHEEHFPLYTGARLEDMVESIRRHGVQSPILVWKTAEGTYIIISGHNRVNASKIAGLTTIPAVIRTDLTQETAEDLFYEMNFRQRSLADMLFSQRVLCIAAHYNMLKRQGRRTDLQTFETTSPDTQEKSHTDVKIAQEYELTRDKVSKYCRYATLYRPLLLLMNSGNDWDNWLRMKSASWRTIAFRSASISLFRKGVPLFPRQKGKSSAPLLKTANWMPPRSNPY